ncbi:Ran-binding 9 [Paramuricea clavata]|uniref:Ran-binding 9 n=1 Tax=Paramuricea clavata TaxID=317549 RepID=A0A7D9IV30_PARCT|nr:Ran-binding 9 [Paramuricea clavata]
MAASIGKIESGTGDAISRLYPKVDESETPLPRSWSPKDKCTFIGLSQTNLRVHYKGVGRTHKDAAAVRTSHSIPASCGLYYFEIKIISKGRDGYMGIGLSANGVNLSRLPGWEKQSYGYHGDDGNSFSSSGTGKPYGPTFTTGDVIGCGVNMIDNSAFYTKNGVKLGTAFTDLPPKLYPTVGLQTPGEIVDANFGQSPFVYDMAEEFKELQAQIDNTIETFHDKHTCCRQAAMQRLVSTYLVHHGYSATAEVFAQTTGQPISEDLASIKNRQRIQKLVLAGRVGEAIEMTQKLYPGLLERNQNLLFLLKCRQFVEMVSGHDSEVRGPGAYSPSRSNKSSPCSSPTHPHSSSSGGNSLNSSPHSSNGFVSNGVQNGVGRDVETLMEIEEEHEAEIPRNGVLNGSASQGEISCSPRREATQKRSSCVLVNSDLIEKILAYGRELKLLSVELKQEHGSNPANIRALEDAFSLLAYNDPHNSPVAYLLDPTQREPVCSALNSAILESQDLPRQPPLELCLGQTLECLKLMAKSGLGACAFTSLDGVLHG